MHLVDEEDDLAVGGLDLLQHCFQTILELAAVLRAGDHRTKIERDHPHVAQRLRNVAGDDALGESFNDRCLADARFADEDRIVLRAAAEDLHDAANLGIASDDRVELAPPRLGDEIAAVFFEGLVFVFGVLIGDALIAADGLQTFQDVVFADAVNLEDVFRLAAAREGEEQVFGGDVLVTHPLGTLLSSVENGAEFLREVIAGADAFDFRKAVHLAADDRLHLVDVDAELVEQRPHDAVGLVEERSQQVHRFDGLLASIGSKLDRPLDRFLGLDGELIKVECHGVSRSPTHANSGAVQSDLKQG